MLGNEKKRETELAELIQKWRGDGASLGDCIAPLQLWTRILLDMENAEQDRDHEPPFSGPVPVVAASGSVDANPPKGRYPSPVANRRDQFAAHAIQGLLAHQAYNNRDLRYSEFIARHAWSVADAMGALRDESDTRPRPTPAVRV